MKLTKKSFFIGLISIIGIYYTSQMVSVQSGRGQLKPSAYTEGKPTIDVGRPSTPVEARITELSAEVERISERMRKLENQFALLLGS